MTADASWTGSMPEIYDKALGPALFQPYAEHVAALVARETPGRVLEVAAGTGLVTRALLQALPDAEVVATDLNPAMVAWASAQAPGAAWQVADAQQLELADQSFDAVVCQFGAMFFPDRRRAYGEMARVLRPGGVAHIAIWDVLSGSTLTAAMLESLHAVLPEDTPDFFERVPHGYTNPDEIRADVTAGGLRVATVDRTVLRGTAESARTFVEGLSLGTPLRFLLEKRGDLDTLVAQLGDDLTRRLGDGPVEGDLTALLVRAVRD